MYCYRINVLKKKCDKFQQGSAVRVEDTFPDLMSLESLVYFQYGSNVAARQSTISKSNENVHLLCCRFIIYTAL